MVMAPQVSQTVIVCRRCGTLNRVDHAERLAEEFGVSCRHCGWRGIYRIESIKTIDRAV